MAELWLQNKSTVIIGGTSGIGMAAAKCFVDNGARVVALGLEDRGAASELRDDRCKVIIGDATQSETSKSAVETCLNHFGSFDGLFHVAGGSGRRFGDGPLHEMTLEGWNKTLALNLTSIMLSNQAAINAFIERGSSGSILNVGSVLAQSPSPKYFTTHAYAASKSAVIGFSKSIASYYAKSNIRINVIAPGLVDTPMAQRAAGDSNIINFIKTKQPLDGGRIGKPADLTAAALYFMSDFSSFTTGQVLNIDGGWSITEGQY